jgi:hypothetical protein
MLPHRLHAQLRVITGTLIMKRQEHVATVRRAAEYFDRHKWLKPLANELALVALDGNGKTLEHITVKASDGDQAIGTHDRRRRCRSGAVWRQNCHRITAGSQVDDPSMTSSALSIRRDV